MEMALRLPSSYVNVEQGEMEYVDGGFSVSVSASTINSTVKAFGFANRGGVGTVTALMAPAIPVMFAWVNALPFAGQLIYGLICLSAFTVASYVAVAYFSGRGLKFSAGWTSGLTFGLI